MPKLSDTQLVILSTAAKRSDGAILPIAKRIKLDQEGLSRVLNGLLKKKLVSESPAENGAIAWRESKDGSRFSLSITESGLRAIGIEPQDHGAESGAGAERAESGGAKSQKRKKVAKASGAAKKRSRVGESAAPRANTKQATVIEMLRRANGATVDELTEATGWQPHSVRGVMSGALKKKLKLKIASEKVERRGRVYRIVERS